MKTLHALLAAFALSVGCTTTSPEADNLRVVHEKTAVAGCKSLGFVDAKPPFVLPSDAMNEMKEKAGALGADTLLVTNYTTRATGIAYDCSASVARTRDGGNFAAGSESCDWTVALPAAENWIENGQPSGLFRCDGVGIKKISVKIEDRHVGGTIWLDNRTKQDDKPVTVFLDLIAEGKVIDEPVEITARFDWTNRGNVLRVKVKDGGNEREGFDILAVEPFDPDRVELRIRLTPGRP